MNSKVFTPRSEVARQKVRDAAGALLADEGVPAFSIDEISRRSGVAKTTIYRHWPSVHALLVDTVACQVEVLPTPDTGSLRSDLGTLFGQIMPTSDIGGRRRMMLGLMQAADDDPSLRDAFDEMMRQRSQPLRNVLLRARARGEITTDISLDDAVDVLEGPIIYRFMLRGEPFDQRVLDSLLDVVVAGLTRPQGTLSR